MTDFSLPIEVVAVAIASLVLILAVRYPHPAHLSTTILLTLFTGVLLWANLRPTAWEEEWGGGDPPTELDPLSKALFWRGWPLSPFMFCIDGLKMTRTPLSGWALAFDGALFPFALFSVRAACEGCLRWRRSTSSRIMKSPA